VVTAEDNEMMFWGNHMGLGGWGFLLNAVLWLGLVALGIWLLARLFPRVGGQSRSDSDGRNWVQGPPENTAPPNDTAMQILRRRYARGELSKEEYETMRHDLAS
jgi:uncharacterized membrane protein